MVPGICFWLVARPSWSSAFFDLWEWAKCPAMWQVHSGFQIKTITIQATDWSAKSCKQGAWYVTVIITSDAARSPVMTSLSFQDKLKNWCHSNLQNDLFVLQIYKTFFSATSIILRPALGHRSFPSLAIGKQKSDLERRNCLFNEQKNSKYCL